MNGRNIDSLLCDVSELLTLPSVYLQVRRCIDDPDLGLVDLARVVSLDPALSARVLSIANSALFGLHTDINSVAHAVNLLGNQIIHDIVLATSLASTFRRIPPGRMDMQRFWQDSVRLGVTSRAVAAEVGVLDEERLFMHGLLADIGSLVLYQSLPEDALHCLDEAALSGDPRHLVEARLLGFDHADLGARLAEQWQLPAGLVNSIRYQYRHDGPPSVDFDARLLRMARMLCNPATPDNRGLGEVALPGLQMNETALDNIRSNRDALFSEAMSLLAIPEPSGA